MAGVRVLAGTRKGAFVLTSDGRRDLWEISGPHFAGWEIYHVKGSPADPDRLYASQSSGWSGQVIQRSDDGGQTWAPVGNQFAYDGTPGTHQWYDGTPHPWDFTGCGTWSRPWMTRTPSGPGSRTPGCSGRATAASPGRKCPRCAATTGPSWQPGAGGMCLHTILLGPRRAGCSLRSPPRGRSAARMRARPGGPPTTA